MSLKFILIAYDCDFNFEPCNKNGKKAHWALITGYVFPFEPIQYESLSNLSQDTSIIDLNSVSELFDVKSLVRNNHDDKKLFVICKHGKSRQSGVWNLKSLIESCRQLKEVGDNRDSKDYVLPSGGDIQKTLSSKAIVFY